MTGSDGPVSLTGTHVQATEAGHDVGKSFHQSEEPTSVATREGIVEETKSFDGAEAGQGQMPKSSGSMEANKAKAESVEATEEFTEEICSIDDTLAMQAQRLDMKSARTNNQLPSAQVCSLYVLTSQSMQNNFNT